MAALTYRTIILALQSTEEISTLANILLENYTGSVIEHNFRDMQTSLNIKRSRHNGAKIYDLYSSCRNYEPRPIHKMTNAEANVFAILLADDARKTMSLSKEETVAYANAIYSSILYFNNRSKEHKAHMRYLKECEIIKREMEEQRKREEMQKKQIHIIIK